MAGIRLARAGISVKVRIAAGVLRLVAAGPAA
jgi:hypothetical protein